MEQGFGGGGTSGPTPGILSSAETADAILVNSAGQMSGQLVKPK